MFLITDSLRVLAEECVSKELADGKTRKRSSDPCQRELLQIPQGFAVWSGYKSAPEGPLRGLLIILKELPQLLVSKSVPTE